MQTIKKISVLAIVLVLLASLSSCYVQQKGWHKAGAAHRSGK